MANAGPSTIQGPGTLRFNSTGQGFLVDNSSSVAPTDPELTVSATITGTGGFIKDGGGMMLLNGANAYTGNTVISRGVVRVAGGQAIPDDNIISLANAVSAGLEVADGETETIGGVTGGGGYAGFIRLNGTGQLNVGDGLNQNFSGLLMGGTPGIVGFVKSGTGNLTLNGNLGGQINSSDPQSGQLSSYVGDIFVTGSGKLLLGAQYALPMSSTVIIDSTGTLDINNVSDPIMGSLSGDGSFTNSNATARNAFIGADGANETFNGRLTGTTIGIWKIGSGTQTFNNTVGSGSTSTMSLVIQNGTVALAGAGTTNPVNFGNIYARGTSTLLIDNTEAAANRIDDARNLILGGGTVWFKPNASADTTETVNSLNWEHGSGTIVLEASESYQSVLDVKTFTAYGTGDWWHPILVQGTGLGSAAPGGGVANLMATTNANLWNGFRPEVVGVTNTTGDMTDISYLTYDATKGFRPMAAGELVTITPTTNTNNAGRLDSALLLTNPGRTVVGGLRMEPGASVTMGSSGITELRLSGNSILVQPNAATRPSSAAGGLARTMPASP